MFGNKWHLPNTNVSHFCHKVQWVDAAAASGKSEQAKWNWIIWLECTGSGQTRIQNSRFYKDTWFCSSRLNVPLKLPARQIPWNTGNTYTQSPLLLADIISLHPSHKTNVPPNRKAILQCITLSERTSAPHPVSLNLCLICLVLLWAFRSNYALSLPVESALPVNENVHGWWSQILLYLLSGRPNAAVSSLIWSV